VVDRQRQRERVDRDGFDPELEAETRFANRSELALDQTGRKEETGE